MKRTVWRTRTRDGHTQVLHGDTLTATHDSTSAAVAHVGRALTAAPLPAPTVAATGTVWVIPEGQETSDGALLIEVDALDLTARAEPLPFMWQTVTEQGHDGAVLVGRLTNLRREEGGWIVADLELDDTPEGRAAIEDAANRDGRYGVSADFGVNASEFECTEEDDDGFCMQGLERVTAGELLGACYSDDTEVLTEARGWQRFADLLPGERVATRAPKTGAFEWQEPTHYTNDAWTGELIHFRSKSLDLLVTPNHRMLTIDKAGREQFMRADELERKPAGTVRKLPATSQWHDDDVAMFRIAGPDAVPVGTCACGCGQPTTQTPRWFGGRAPGTWQKTLPGHGHGLSTHGLTLEGDDFAAFMGMWLAEGHLNGSSPGRVSVCQMRSSRGFEAYEQVLTRILGRPAPHDGRKFSFSNVRLCDYLKQFGHAPDKFIPTELKNFSRRQLRIFWDHYMLGDGSADGRRAYTTSRRLADDLQEVAQKIGLWANVAPRPHSTSRTFIRGREILPENKLPAYLVNIRQKVAAVWHWDVSRVAYDGMVRCVTVPNETLYVRRNGKAVWCGNTGVMFPYFAEARVELAALGDDAPVDDGEPTPGVDEDVEADQDAAAREVVLLASASAGPALPPASWFDDPQLTGPTHLTVGDDGRITGHLAAWGTCHIGRGDVCITPPVSAAGYAYYRTGLTHAACDDGCDTGATVAIPTGVLTMGIGHADRTLDARSAAAHYDDVTSAVADVVAGEDAHGIWLAGALRPDITPEQVRALRGSDVSGDWRDIGGRLELVAALAVNVAGFPVPRAAGLVRDGRQTSLVAAGIVHARPSRHDDGDVLRRLAVVERRQAVDLLTRRVHTHA